MQLNVLNVLNLIALNAIKCINCMINEKNDNKIIKIVANWYNILLEIIESKRYWSKYMPSES